MFKTIVLLILSFILSSIIWFSLVSLQQNIKFFEQGIPVKSLNVPEGLSVSSEIPNIQVKVDALNEVFKEMKTDDFQAFIDFTNAQIGTSSFPIQVKSQSSKIRIVYFYPKEIKATFEELKEKTMKVVFETIGNIDPGFTIQEQKIDIKEVQTKAGEAALKKAHQVKAILKLNNEQNDFTREIKLIAVDIKGNTIEEVKIVPEYANIEVILTQITEVKTVGIKVPIIGELGTENLYIDSIKITPNTTELRGKKYYLNTIENVQTNPIDISNINQSKTIFMKIIAPLNTEIVGRQTVKVRINIDKIKVE